MLSGDPAEFALHARMLIGPAEGPGEESFDITVCTSEWVAEACRKAGGIYNPRHHLVIDSETSTSERCMLGLWLGCRRCRRTRGRRSGSG